MPTSKAQKARVTITCVKNPHLRKKKKKPLFNVQAEHKKIRNIHTKQKQTPQMKI
jgi:hypothetical protein